MWEQGPGGPGGFAYPERLKEGGREGGTEGRGNRNVRRIEGFVESLVLDGNYRVFTTDGTAASQTTIHIAQ